jgi:hypothetical protein
VRRFLVLPLAVEERVMRRRWLEDKEHLARMAGVFVVGIVVVLVLQTVFVPAGFGRYGHYRAGALDDNRLRQVAYAGGGACEPCHADVVEARRGGAHEHVGCEACHGPLAAHAVSPVDAKATRPDTRARCLVCHLQNTARPRRFSQIRVPDHSDAGPCTACHQAHSPRIG